MAVGDDQFLPSGVPSGLTESSAEMVAWKLGSRILSGEISPGAPLREVVLARQLGVSRNTFREGLRLLVFQGLVVHIQNRGAHVVRLDASDAHEIYDVRRVLELAALERTASSRPIDIRPLGVALAELEKAAEVHDWQRLVETDLQFHRSLVDMLGSRRMLAFFDTIKSQLLLAFAIVSLRDQEYVNPQRIVDEHQQLYDAIVRGDSEVARRLLTEHLDYYEARCVATFATDGTALSADPKSRERP